jgi:hypothetical protein
MWQRHWVSSISAGVVVLTVSMTQPVLANSLSVLIQNPQFMRNLLVIVVGWGVWYLIHPRILAFLGGRSDTTADDGELPRAVVITAHRDVV